MKRITRKFLVRKLKSKIRTYNAYSTDKADTNYTQGWNDAFKEAIKITEKSVI